MNNKKLTLKEPYSFSGFLLERTAKRMKLNLQRQLKEINAGITVDQWLILNTLLEQDGLSQFQICESLTKDAPTITRILDLLSKKKMLARKADKTDRRKFKIFLTVSGKRKAEEIYPLVIQFRQQAYSNVKEKDLKSIEKALLIINENLNTL
jgi:DNA-binding MarR family transcriptional regulator